MEQIIFASILLKDATDVEKFLEFAQAGHHDRNFFATHVRELHLRARSALEPIASVLTLCTNVRNIACWVPTDFSHTLTEKQNYASAISSLRPARASLRLQLAFSQSERGPASHPDLTAPFFSHITHLEVVDAGWTQWDWSIIKTPNSKVLPCVTHIQFTYFGAHRSMAPDISAIAEILSIF